jgi:hypothetical protein
MDRILFPQRQLADIDLRVGCLKVLRNPSLRIEEVQDLEEELVELLGLGGSAVEVLFGLHVNHDVVTLRATKRVERMFPCFQSFSSWIGLRRSE